MRHYIITYTVETIALEHAPDEETALKQLRAARNGQTIDIVTVQDVTRDYRKARTTRPKP